MGPTKELGILGYSTEEKIYTYYGADNSGMVMGDLPGGLHLQVGDDGRGWFVDELHRNVSAAPEVVKAMGRSATRPVTR